MSIGDDEMLKFIESQTSRFKKWQTETNQCSKSARQRVNEKCLIFCRTLNQNSQNIEWPDDRKWWCVRNEHFRWPRTTAEVGLIVYWNIAHDQTSVTRDVSPKKCGEHLRFEWQTSELFNLHVLSQVSHWAAGHFSGVDPMMLKKIAPLTKCLLTEITLVWLLSGVYPLMSFKVWSVTEGFLTHLALVWSLPGVCSLVCFKIRFLVKWYTDNTTYPRLLSSVCHLVRFKRPFAVKWFTAHITYVWLVSRVYHLVLPEKRTISENFPTYSTLVLSVFFGKCLVFPFLHLNFKVCRHALRFFFLHQVVCLFWTRRKWRHTVTIGMFINRAVLNAYEEASFKNRLTVIRNSARIKALLDQFLSSKRKKYWKRFQY